MKREKKQEEPTFSTYAIICCLPPLRKPQWIWSVTIHLNRPGGDEWDQFSGSSEVRFSTQREAEADCKRSLRLLGIRRAAGFGK